MKNRAEELARAIRASKIWDMSQLAELSSLAGMDQEWADADGETFEAIAFAAADKLGVELTHTNKARGGHHMQVREIITIAGWIDGSGWSYQDTYASNIITVADADTARESISWDWWEIGDDADEGGDTKITVTHYAVDDEDCEQPLAAWSIWASELREERKQ